MRQVRYMIEAVTITGKETSGLRLRVVHCRDGKILERSRLDVIRILLYGTDDDVFQTTSTDVAKYRPWL